MPIPLPKKPHAVQKDGFRAVIEVENLYPGYGMTLGNALRRVLLSSLEGAAVTLVKIKGVSHEFSTIPSVAEDVVQILLNVKRLRFKMHADEPQKVTVHVSGEKEVSGKDIVTPTQVEVVNPSAHIATLTSKKASFEVEMTVEKGFGYVPVESRTKEKLEVGTMALDAIFTPIRKINFEVENMRVGERTDFDRLRFTIETDGTIDPEEAFAKASRILVEQFQELTAPAEGQLVFAVQKKEEAAAPAGSALDMPVGELGLSSRVAHALQAAGIVFVRDLSEKTEADISEYEGMGTKAVSDVKKALKKLGLALKE